MLHDSHNPNVDSDVARDADQATASSDPAVGEVIEIAAGASPELFGEGAGNPFRDWQPDGEARPAFAVDDDGVTERAGLGESGRHQDRRCGE